ncbi:ABC transporter permease [Aquisphaera insulae]|uniref:ABC transporter permease n=1 Tax=Aquisphaera insulae TaxID=2712864 RepID=UPI0013E9EE88|nr:ABC transporter permease subunit [Aquisphaera insulae]
MPILEQGYQHWAGSLHGHAWRWAAITRQGIRAQAGNKWLRWIFLGAFTPALVLAGFLVFWGLFEQKSSVLAPLLFLFQGLPEELRAGPRGFRTTFWTLAFNTFLRVELYFSMLLVLLAGPELISQDLRFNAIPLYFSRPVRRIDYFLGKFGVVAAFLSAVIFVPVVLAYALGVGFSLDPLVFRDTWRIFAGTLAYGAIVVVSAGTLILAVSSLSKNSRYVGAMWVGIWIVSGIAAGQLGAVVRQPWCPLVSYVGNLDRIREGLLDTPAAYERLRSLFQAGQDQLRQGARPSLLGGRRRRGPDNMAPPLPRPPEPPRLNGPSGTSTDEKAADLPWPWSLAVLAGLGVLSVGILSVRIRSLDRLR